MLGAPGLVGGVSVLIASLKEVNTDCSCSFAHAMQDLDQAEVRRSNMKRAKSRVTQQ